MNRQQLFLVLLLKGLLKLPEVKFHFIDLCTFSVFILHTFVKQFVLSVHFL